MNKFSRFLLRLVFSSVFAFALLEGGLAWLCATGRLTIQRPSYSLPNVWSRFWVDSNPFFGVWHAPHSSYRHITPEIRLTYRANARGMRDRERETAANGRKRVVMLGDSFMEGWGVASEDRLSDRLEQATGLEHLNFGVSGSFGPTQSYLLYEHLAKTFEHDAVIFAILPDNDFLDDDYEYGLKMHRGRYRPFFVGKDPDYKLVYTPLAKASTFSHILEQALRQFTYTGNLIKYMKSMARHRQASVADHYAGYFDFTPDQWARLQKVLKELRRAAGDKPVLVLTIPCDTDLRRTEHGGAAPLPAKLEETCRSLGMQYLDLLPPILADQQGWPQCYLKTDRHWSAHGNEVAANAVLHSAAFYRSWNAAPAASVAPRE
jgi:hypothetical protein